MKYLKLVLLVVFVFSCGLEASSVGFSRSRGGFLDLKECELGNTFLAGNEKPVCMNVISVDEEFAGEKQIYYDIRKNKEATLIRSASITGAVFGVIPGVIYMGNGYFEPNVILGTAGGGIVGGVSGFLYSKALIASRPSKLEGVFRGGILGGVAGAATYATAGGLFLAGPTGKDSVFNYGVGIILGSVVGAAAGVVVGGFSGLVASDYLMVSEGAFLNIQNENVGLGLPLPTLEVCSFSPDELQCSFELVSVNF